MSNYVIGIDLGTTNTCAAVFLDGKIKLLENVEGERLTPSFVYFLDNKKKNVIVGPYGKKMAAEKPELGVYEFKRLIGCDFAKNEAANNPSCYPFITTETIDGKIAINLEYESKKIVKSPEEVTSALLKKIKTDVSSKLGQIAKKTIITIPAYFSMERIKTTLEAAKMAGFKVLKLLNEPTAAALSYFFEFNEDQSNSYYLVYDLGGGTFDVAVLNRNGDKMQTLAIDGDAHLGGKDFDILIVHYVYKWLEDNNFEVPKDKRTMRRIQIISEEAKKSLSFVDETNIILEGFIPGSDVIDIPLNRELFEKMISGLLKKTIDILDSCLESAKIEKSFIKEVILSGGSTRIPKVQQLISEYFDNKDLVKCKNHDECEGERTDVRKNRYLDSVRLNNLTPLPPGQCEIVVYFNLDLNGILTVKIEEENTKNMKQRKIKYTRRRRSDNEIRKTVEHAEKNKIKDDAFAKFAIKKTYLFAYCVRCIYNFEDQKLVAEYKDLYHKCRKTMSKINYYEIDKLTKIEQMTEEMKSLLELLVEKYKFKYMPSF